MNHQKKWIGIGIGSLVLIALVAGALAFGFTTQANAQAANTNPVLARDEFRGRGPGFPGARGVADTYLAEVLGISEEDLQAARETANQAALDVAVEQGLLTSEEAEAMKVLGLPLRFGLKGEGLGLGAEIDYDALLADALGISTDDLQAARQAAQEAALAQAVEDGRLTQEQADLMVARQALQSYLNPRALLAEALGISVDTLQTYRETEMSMADILDEVGMTATEVRTALQTARDNAVQQAVDDGVITEEQADQILSSAWGREFGFDCGLVGPGRGGMRGGFRGEFPGGMRGPELPGFNHPFAPDTGGTPSTSGSGA